MNTLLAALLLAACAAMASAECSTLDRLLVKQEWASVFSTGNDREQFGTKLWRELFERDPVLRGYFDKVNGDDITSAKFVAHSMRVLGGVDMCIALLDDEPVLNAELEHLRAQHKGRLSARPANPPNAAKGRDVNPLDPYKTFRNALIYILPDVMGANIHDTRAWSDCFDVIRAGMLGIE